MKIGVVGTGYVGLTTGAGLSAFNHEVICMDNQPDKVRQLNDGEVPIYEPGLEDLVRRSLNLGHISFTGDLEEVVNHAEAIFLALPTPENKGKKDGSADLSAMFETAANLGPLVSRFTVIVDKSTVPPGTGEEMQRRIVEAGADPDNVAVVSNPEFLREGSALSDFNHPSFIVVGTESDRAWDVMEEVYYPFVLRDPKLLMRTSVRNAEAVKMSLNSYLAVRASFANELATACEAFGADVTEVRRIMTEDDRVGHKYFFPGGGWGGSCLPKDTRSFIYEAERRGFTPRLVQSAIEVNEAQKRRMVDKVEAYFDGDLDDRTIALWGLSFKKDTDDIRESPSLALIEALASKNARVVAYDPQAMEKTRQHFLCDPEVSERLSFAEDQYDALAGAEALLIATDWDDFKIIDYERVNDLLGQGGRSPVIFDTKNLHIPRTMARHGITYIYTGQPSLIKR